MKTHDFFKLINLTISKMAGMEIKRVRFQDVVASRLGFLKELNLFYLFGEINYDRSDIMIAKIKCDLLDKVSPEEMFIVPEDIHFELNPIIGQWYNAGLELDKTLSLIKIETMKGKISKLKTNISSIQQQLFEQEEILFNEIKKLSNLY